MTGAGAAAQSDGLAGPRAERRGLPESEHQMASERLSYPYQGYTITTLLDDGVWWATVRVATKDAGGDRPVLGGPWGSRLDAQRAAQHFCNHWPVSVAE
jgi:hypothetical protein